MRTIKGLSVRQFAFYTLVFLFGFVYQPKWVNDNFWLKADFYDATPFQVPYILFLLIYSIISVGVTWSVVQWVKKNL